MYYKLAEISDSYQCMRGFESFGYKGDILPFCIALIDTIKDKQIG